MVGYSGGQAEWSLGAALADGLGGGGAFSRERPASEGGHAHDGLITRKSGNGRNFSQGTYF